MKLHSAKYKDLSDAERKAFEMRAEALRDERLEQLDDSIAALQEQIAMEAARAESIHPSANPFNLSACRWRCRSAASDPSSRMVSFVYYFFLLRSRHASFGSVLQWSLHDYCT